MFNWLSLFPPFLLNGSSIGEVTMVKFLCVYYTEYATLISSKNGPLDQNVGGACVCVGACVLGIKSWALLCK